MKKRLLSLFLTVMLVASLLPTIPISVSASESTGNTAFDNFINDWRFAPGVSWNYNQTPKLASFGASGCCAYCADFTKYCFGINNPKGGTVFYNTSEIRAGDVILLGHPSSGTGHWFVCLKRNGNSLYVAEGNYSSKVRVGWNYTISGSNSFSQDSRSMTSGWHFMSAQPATPTPSGPTPISDLPNGFYFLKSALDENYAVSVRGHSTSNNANIELEAYDKNQFSQMFEIKNIDGGNAYYIINHKSGLSMDVQDSSEAPGANLQQCALSSWINTAQRWDFVDAGDGYVYIKNHYYNTYLDVTNGVAATGTNVQMWTGNQTNAQKFKLFLVPPVISCNVSDSTTVGNTVKISWEEPYGTQTYEGYLTEFPEGFAYDTYTQKRTDYGQSYTFSNLPSGKYSFFLHAKNKYATSDQSNWVTFSVYEKEYVPTKTEVYNGHTYKLYDYEASWSFCEELCKELGGHLVTVTSAGEEAFVEALIANGSKDSYWLGLSNYEMKPTGNDDGPWKWCTGESYSYTNWASKEPSNSGTGGHREHWGEIRKSYSNKWNDVNNINKSNKGFILEVETAAPAHSLSQVPAKAATCTADGNSAYWLCKDCGKLFSDANGTIETTLATVTLKALGHNYKNGLCTRCGAADTIHTGKEVHFPKVMSYYQGQFIDVDDAHWFMTNVADAVQFGLMKGNLTKDNSATIFNPLGNVTVAEAITMAARIHSIDTTGTETFKQGEPWYQCYLDYAYQNGIISYAYYNCDVNSKATRAQFAEIFAAAMPDEDLPVINNVADNAIPDVKMTDSYADSVYKLYRAGILAGVNNEIGTRAFCPNDNITRAECAAIAARMADCDNRQHYSLP